MLTTSRYIFVPFLLTIFLLNISSTCNIGRKGTLKTIRVTHVAIVQSFKEADEVIAAQFEHTSLVIADEIISEGIDGSEGFNEWNSRMSKWFAIEAAIRFCRDMLEHLESTYEKLKTDEASVIDWISIISQLSIYVKTIIELAEELNVNLPDKFIHIYDKMNEIINSKR